LDCPQLTPRKRVVTSVCPSAPSLNATTKASYIAIITGGRSVQYLLVQK
jgi:hypothetical protein